MIMGSANTPENIMKYYRRLSLSKCSLNLIEIPKKCTSMVFCDIFEYCVKFNNMIPIAVYKRHSDDSGAQANKASNLESKTDGMGGRADEKSQKKSYMWLHPPRRIELSICDELFVLCERNEKDTMQEISKAKSDISQPNQSGKPMKNEGKKI